MDLRKVMSGSGEMFWRGAFPGYFFETLPELATQADVDTTSLQDEWEKYSNGLQRYMVLTGLQSKSLAPQISNPTQHFDSHVRAIALAKGIPFRIFLGSESAHLASSQDAITWNKRVMNRQQNYLNPMLIRPFVQRLQCYGVLPPAQNYDVEWTDLNSMTDDQKAGVTLKRAQALLQYVTSGSELVYPAKDWLIDEFGLSVEQAQQVIDDAKAGKNDLLTEQKWKQPAKTPFGTSPASQAPQPTGFPASKNALGGANP